MAAGPRILDRPIRPQDELADNRYFWFSPLPFEAFEPASRYPGRNFELFPVLSFNLDVSQFTRFSAARLPLHDEIHFRVRPNGSLRPVRGFSFVFTAARPLTMSFPDFLQPPSFPSSSASRRRHCWHHPTEKTQCPCRRRYRFSYRPVRNLSPLA